MYLPLCRCHYCTRETQWREAAGVSLSAFNGQYLAPIPLPLDTSPLARERERARATGSTYPEVDNDEDDLPF